MIMSKKALFCFVLLSFIHQSINNTNITITSRSLTSPLEQFQYYKDVDMIHLNIPQDTIFASFKFMAYENRLSIFRCSTRNVSVFMKHGAAPVINPDGAPFPKLFKNITRSPVYSLEIPTTKKEAFINITSPSPGSYIAVAFLSYQDPKYNAISQEGLRADCDAYLEASLFISKIDNPLLITDENLFQMTSQANESRYYKFFVPSSYDQAVLFVNTITFPDNSNLLTVRIEANRPPSSEVHHKQEFIYSNSSSSVIFFSTNPDCWHYIEFHFNEGIVDNTTSGNLTFELKFISNELPESSYYYGLLQNETLFNNSVSKTFHDYKLTNLIPYKQYDLIREATSETFFFSFELEKELDSRVPIAMNMTDSHFSLLKFKLREGTDVGGTLQFILAFKPRVEKSEATGKFVFESEPSSHVLVACIRRGAMEIPTWPNKCAYNGVERESQLILNATSENSTVLIPYPESGTWYATFKLFCSDCEPCTCSNYCQDIYKQCVIDCELNCDLPWDCQSCTTNCSSQIIATEECKGCDCDGPCSKNTNASCSTSILFDIGSHPCIFGQCSRNGRCMFLVSDGVVFSTCVCMNKYRGWDCSDNSQATPYSMVVIEFLFLVLSNLLFLPSVYVAYKRKYYVEAVSYLSICFFSVFYHCCDAGENLINMCIVNLSALQFGDFFCAILAIWVTLVAIADLPGLWTNICHMMGAIVLAFFTTINKTSLWVFVVPAITGVILIAASWTVKYRKIKQRFANRNYLFYRLPFGFTIVAVSLTCYAFLQTENNYWYLHSIWHMMMAVSLTLILPKPNTFVPEVIL
ncbi:unnamed protein product [Phyllotreta striolata]|uniref:EGF-like domain-containing protein n=1 Tax=Phyllotreta striolata TaxID=444603 RepID=A0A9N9XSN3_PHYSR|nr:unnamed protein product [Phyllotreta striolata]